MLTDESVTPKKKIRSKFQKHLTILVWKSYLQRLRRWKLLVLETVLAAILYIIAILIAVPVFLTPVSDEPEPAMSFTQMLGSIRADTIIGYAPAIDPYKSIMERATELLGVETLSAQAENDLDILLYDRAKGTFIINKVIWILWLPKEGNVFKFKIRSTEAASYMLMADAGDESGKRDTRRGFMAVQLAVSQAILEHATKYPPNYDLTLVSMPVSPLMNAAAVHRAISFIFLCYTLALLPPVLETEHLVITETQNRFKRGLRIRGVDYTPMYLGWILYALMTALPICIMGSISLILIFRWIHLLYAALTLLAYFCIMMMLALIMSMFQNTAKVACFWSFVQTLLQTFLAELIVHHKLHHWNLGLTFLIKTILPTLGLLNGLNEFALVQVGRSMMEKSTSMVFTLLSWTMLNVIYFLILLLLQYTIGSERAIGGQVSWKTIIFKKAEDRNKLRPVVTPKGEPSKLQEVDELIAKAITFRNVSKEIMNVPILTNVSFDIYRGELSFILASRVQDRMMATVEDLLTGLTFCDSGEITILGVQMSSARNLVSEPLMVGLCENSSFLINDMTVEEHLYFYINEILQICVWNESNSTVMEYTYIRTHHLLEECDLISVRKIQVERLGTYYRAQLCWAIAMLLEPKIVIVPSNQDNPLHTNVIKDKIMKHRNHVTIVKLCLSSLELEFADRLFVLDNRHLAFGGTPAYMFFKFGREYRIRLNLRSSDNYQDIMVHNLLRVVKPMGATVRAFLGSMLILRIPTSPSKNVLRLVQCLQTKYSEYGIIAMNISLPDPEEVFKRARSVSIAEEILCSVDNKQTQDALQKIAVGNHWQEKTTHCYSKIHLSIIAWKYFSFYIHYRFLLILTILSAFIAGVVIGLSLTSMLKHIELDNKATEILKGQQMTIEWMNMETTLVMRVDNKEASRSVANAYVLSHTGYNKTTVKQMSYIALDSSESLTEYLVTYAIDAPQEYVVFHTYGIDISVVGQDTIYVQALYSPLHSDHSAAARSIARVYMALLRHFTGQLDAAIEIYDEPLVLDLTPWMAEASEPAIVIQFLLVLTISHMVLVPSHEHGFIRHAQKHARRFSPMWYWCTLAFCDLVHYWMLAIFMAGVAFVIMFALLFDASRMLYIIGDLLSVPIMLIVYGVGCVPQAYLFSLGPRPTLNSMALIIVNMVFGEATIIAKLFYGDVYNYAVSFMALSPQYNMAYAFVKIRQTFLYNSECIIFEMKKLCTSKVLHKCCSKCGVLQSCFVRKSYLSNIMTEIIATLVTSVIFISLLLLWEYRIVHLVWQRLWRYKPDLIYEVGPGALKERADVYDKMDQLKRSTNFQKLKLDTFGEYLLSVDASREENDIYVVQNVCLGVGKGEALAISGLKRHGRINLVEMLAGYKSYDEGSIWAMSKFTSKYNNHLYCRNISYCGADATLPEWMTVFDGLHMLGLLRGVPRKWVRRQVEDVINALDLHEQSDLLICRLSLQDHRKLQFAAAIIGAPPILIFEECTAHQTYSVRRSMYRIMAVMRKQGHAIVHSAVDVESHMPVSNRLAIIRDGMIYDVDYVGNLLGRYSDRGYTVVVHLKDEVDIQALFAPYFSYFVVNDASDVLVNVQVLDETLTWESIFTKMEQLQNSNKQVYQYIVCAKPIDYIYSTIISAEKGYKYSTYTLRPFLSKYFRTRRRLAPPPDKVSRLMAFPRKYSLSKLKELPWSVIFQEP